MLSLKDSYVKKWYNFIESKKNLFCIHIANALDVNIEDIINMKMDKNEMKYPVEKAKGKNNEKIHKIIIKAILRNIKKIYDLRDI